MLLSFGLVLVHPAEACAACNRCPNGAVTMQPRATPWGEDLKQTEALKGRDNFPKRPPRSVRSFEVLGSHITNDLPGMKGFVTPLQGLVVSSRRGPRALPWAALLQPVPGEESVLRRPPHQDEQHPLIDSFEFGARINRMNQDFPRIGHAPGFLDP